jgi:phosphoserine phosphatase RsbU/P
LEADGPATAMFEGMTYETATVPLGPFAMLLVYSDGVYEIEKADGVMWQDEEFVEFVAKLVRAKEPVRDKLLTYVRQLGRSEVLADDFSMIEVQF